MSTLKLTICAKTVRKTVGEHGSTATSEIKPIVLCLLMIRAFSDSLTDVPMKTLVFCPLTWIDTLT